MNSIDKAAVNQLEVELTTILKKEYSFYQSLYILLDRQRDIIKFKKDEHLLDLFAEIERCHQRIRKSGENIDAIRQRNPQLFDAAKALPGVRKIVNSIVTLLKKNSGLVQESEEYLRDKYDRIKSELGELQHSHKIMQYLNTSYQSAQLVDGKK